LVLVDEAHLHFTAQQAVREVIRNVFNSRESPVVISSPTRSSLMRHTSTSLLNKLQEKLPIMFLTFKRELVVTSSPTRFSLVRHSSTSLLNEL
jgi:hypothetical protein